MDTSLFIKTYESLTKDNCEIIKDIYHPDVEFEDPIRKTFGLSELLPYLSDSYQNVHYCRFQITDSIEQENQACVRWLMRLSHPKLSQGRELTVHGCSVLHYQDELIIYHRDYFDLGEMVYQNIPILGSVVAMIRQRLKG